MMNNISDQHSLIKNKKKRKKKDKGMERGAEYGTADVFGIYAAPGRDKAVADNARGHTVLGIAHPSPHPTPEGSGRQC